MKIKHENLAKLANVTKRTIINWEKDERLILELIERYFTDIEIQEFLERKAIGKWEFLRNSYNEEIKENVISFKNILDEISNELINYNDQKNFNDMSIIFMKIILYLSNEANPSKFYNISEVILVYAKKKEDELSESIVELNKIISANVKNKSFIPFLYELGKNDLIDLFDDKIFNLGKSSTEFYFIPYILPYWDLKYNSNENYELKQTTFDKSTNIFEKLFPNYDYEEKYTKREIVKMFKEYYQELKN